MNSVKKGKDTQNGKINSNSFRKLQLNFDFQN